MHLLITIDGPAGVGKSTVSRMLAERLEYRYIDTGALYRAVALFAQNAGVRPDDYAGVETLCRHLALKFSTTECGQRLFANGKDITEAIRRPEISILASAFSALPVVRRYLLDIQREMGREKKAVFEGRDMGTVVFPDADIKFFLDADIKTRAMRRFRQDSIHAGLSIEEIISDIRTRDEKDRTRAIAPLKPAIDAIYIDSSDLSIEEVVLLLLSKIQERI